jgi:hypothetical protein
LREASEATGLSTRHLRRLLAQEKLEGVMADDGRRYVTTSSLLQAGLSLSAPDHGSPQQQDRSGGQVSALQEEVTRLRARLDEAERRAVAAEDREAWARLTIDRILTALPAGPDRPLDASGGEVTPAVSRRWWRKRQSSTPIAAQS